MMMMKVFILAIVIWFCFICSRLLSRVWLATGGTGGAVRRDREGGGRRRQKTAFRRASFLYFSPGVQEKPDTPINCLLQLAPLALDFHVCVSV